MGQENIKAYYQLWNELWKLFRTWIKEYQDDDSFWQRLLKDADAFSAKYKGTEQERFVNKTIITMAEELETIALEQRRLE